jgi:hypothetical protein
MVAVLPLQLPAAAAAPAPNNKAMKCMRYDAQTAATLQDIESVTLYVTTSFYRNSTLSIILLLNLCSTSKLMVIFVASTAY